MFTQTSISNEEMRYFQFKARQLFLLRKENHEWNEFCKRNACTCCSCQPATQPKATKEMAVQASPRKPPFASHARNPRSVTSDQTVMQALNEVKTRLEHIDLALSGRTMEQNTNQRFSEANFPSSIVPVEFLMDPERGKRIQLIQSSLKQSIQRLQSSGQLKSRRPPINVKKKSSGFFLPHELQKQRTAARNAYLASLTKFKSQPPTSSGSATKEKNSNKQVSIPSKIQKPKGVSKTRKDSCLKLKTQEKEVQTLITSDELTEVKKPSSIVQQTNDETSAKLHLEKDLMGEKISQPLLSHWVKIRENLPQLNIQSGLNRQIPKIDHPNGPKHQTGEDNDVALPPSHPEPETPASSQSSFLRLKKELVMEPKSVQEISWHRREYMHYLERVSRKKTGNFDPCTLSNMISEFLLNECIEVVAEELQDVPGVLVTDLYDQEFLQTV